MDDEIYTDDDYIVTLVMQSHNMGYIRVITYGPYTKTHAQKVRKAYESMAHQGNWDYKYYVTRMRRESEEVAA